MLDGLSDEMFSTNTTILMSNNKIYEFPQYLFRKYLNFALNQLKWIDAEDFEKNLKLAVLEISDNQIFALDPKIIVIGRSLDLPLTNNICTDVLSCYNNFKEFTVSCGLNEIYGCNINAQIFGPFHYKFSCGHDARALTRL